MTLDLITSPLLDPLRHAFFGRAGGASSGVFAGLNCGNGSTDQAEAVTINRRRVAEAMGVEPEALLGVHQVHSADVVVVDGPLTGKPRADAMVTRVPGLALSVLTADCQPVLFADSEAGVIGAAHAGWKGTLGGILEATVAAMEGLGAKASRIHAVIGPTISQRAYEVGPEFMDTVLAEDPRAARYFANGHGDRLLFDLPGYGLQRLRQAGVGEAEWTRHCTYLTPDRFFSYRRSVHAREADYGRLIAAIRL
ncbi:peptidoglycan editing factor PgeF [Rubellimicrobium aerolatum]|uniref:Purine nucleoside phosphorylase n=1 Tax=Rubellimicrobium aerolatum TaxID=490979 RepID=A0ABW0SDK7_9RHOB|nr:peptidoglycan editing factor PgeF [Rubellimicrobium aerolatum]MBP1805703.1 YfiH family protein [Rubellimicrobium aerolatum]